MYFLPEAGAKKQPCLVASAKGILVKQNQQNPPSASPAPGLHAGEWALFSRCLWKSIKKKKKKHRTFPCTLLPIIRFTKRQTMSSKGFAAKFRREMVPASARSGEEEHILNGFPCYAPSRIITSVLQHLSSGISVAPVFDGTMRRYDSPPFFFSFKTAGPQNNTHHSGVPESLLFFKKKFLICFCFAKRGLVEGLHASTFPQAVCNYLLK